MVTKKSRDKNNFIDIHTNIINAIETATEEIQRLQIKTASGITEIGSISARLEQSREKFSHELNLLNKNAEWDKFTVAFFGETNAGKSTIIESLRIIFKAENE